MRGLAAIRALAMRLAASFLLLAVLAVAPAAAEGAGRVPLPSVPKAAKGDACVADTAFMRKNHMKMLMHQRDATMHEGIRTPQFSLKECFTCHQTPGADGKAITVADPKHFCRSCHDYAAVRVDCFECHASRLEGAAGKAAMPDDKEHAALADYLKGIAR